MKTIIISTALLLAIAPYYAQAGVNDNYFDYQGYVEMRLKMEMDLVYENFNTAFSKVYDKAFDDSKQYTDDAFLNYHPVISTADNSASYREALSYTDNAVKESALNASHYTDLTVARANSAWYHALSANNTRTDLLEKRVASLEKKITRLDNRMSAGIAGVMAVSSIPYVSENTFSYGLAVGNYRNGNALAGGIQYKTSFNSNIRVNASLDSQHNSMVGAGFAGGW